MKPRRRMVSLIVLAGTLAMVGTATATDLGAYQAEYYTDADAECIARGVIERACSRPKDPESIVAIVILACAKTDWEAEKAGGTQHDNTAIDTLRRQMNLLTDDDWAGLMQKALAILQETEKGRQQALLIEKIEETAGARQGAEILALEIIDRWALEYALVDEAQELKRVTPYGRAWDVVESLGIEGDSVTKRGGDDRMTAIAEITAEMKYRGEQEPHKVEDELGRELERREVVGKAVYRMVPVVVSTTATKRTEEPQVGKYDVRLTTKREEAVNVQLMRNAHGVIKWVSRTDESTPRTRWLIKALVQEDVNDQAAKLTHQKAKALPHRDNKDVDEAYTVAGMNKEYEQYTLESIRGSQLNDSVKEERIAAVERGREMGQTYLKLPAKNGTPLWIKLESQAATGAPGRRGIAVVPANYDEEGAIHVPYGLVTERAWNAVCNRMGEEYANKTELACLTPQGHERELQEIRKNMARMVADQFGIKGEGPRRTVETIEDVMYQNLTINRHSMSYEEEIEIEMPRGGWTGSGERASAEREVRARRLGESQPRAAPLSDTDQRRDTHAALMHEAVTLLCKKQDISVEEAVANAVWIVQNRYTLTALDGRGGRVTPTIAQIEQVAGAVAGELRGVSARDLTRLGVFPHHGFMAIRCLMSAEQTVIGPAQYILTYGRKIAQTSERGGDELRAENVLIAEFMQPQHITGDGACGIYAAGEGSRQEYSRLIQTQASKQAADLWEEGRRIWHMNHANAALTGWIDAGGPLNARIDGIDGRMVHMEAQNKIARAVHSWRAIATERLTTYITKGKSKQATP
ncbi:MAG: hypothetical protein LBD43_00120, partial [Holosporales bacterium]|nr:hypothetical protein [Holosporales bacterium]